MSDDIFVQPIGIARLADLLRYPGHDDGTGSTTMGETTRDNACRRVPDLEARIMGHGR